MWCALELNVIRKKKRTAETKLYMLLDDPCVIIMVEYPGGRGFSWTRPTVEVVGDWRLGGDLLWSNRIYCIDMQWLREILIGDEIVI